LVLELPGISTAQAWFVVQTIEMLNCMREDGADVSVSARSDRHLLVWPKNG